MDHALARAEYEYVILRTRARRLTRVAVPMIVVDGIVTEPNSRASRTLSFWGSARKMTVRHPPTHLEFTATNKRAILQRMPLRERRQRTTAQSHSDTSAPAPQFPYGVNSRARYDIKVVAISSAARQPGESGGERAHGHHRPARRAWWRALCDGE